MKKAIITSAIAILLVAGYFVGQAKIESESSGRKSSAADQTLGLRNTDSDTSKSSGRSFSALDEASEKDSSLAVGNTLDPSIGIDCAIEDCSTYSEPMPGPDPTYGDPKGKTIIKSGTVEITIPRNTVGKKFDKVVSLIPEGGYVEASESTKRTTTLTVRIPAGKLDETLVALRKLGTIEKESVGSVDRSYDAVDYEARLKIMREREVVLNELLKKASSVSETASIQEQIFALRTQIESLQGQQNLLKEQVALSTLTISLTEKGVKAEKSEGKSILGKAWTTSAGAMLTSISGMLIVFTATLPFLLFGAVLAYAIRSFFRKSKKVKSTKVEASKE